MNNDSYWYGFRQMRPPGEIVICGPFDSHDEAIRDREISKASDCQVGIPFTASSKEVALKRVTTFMP